MHTPRYDSIGGAYAATRHEDPDLRARVWSALGESRTVVNVGAGTGLYEPRDRHVIAIEPSDVMAAQRAEGLAPALRGSAGHVMLRDDSVDAAMAINTVHHWDDELEDGVRELRRVARGPVVIVTVDAAVCSQMWLLRDYLPEAAQLDRATFPSIDHLTRLLGGTIRVETVLTSRDSPDWTLGSFWAHPERVLDETARRSTSGFTRMAPEIISRVVTELTQDLRDGSWDSRNAHLRDLTHFDTGTRLLVAVP